MALSGIDRDGTPFPGADRQRQSRRVAFAAARSHSRTVRRLRLMLPVAGALTVAALVLATRSGLPGDLDLSMARMSVTPNAIIMDDPRLTGFDADKREYSVTADRAIQALTDPNAVRLEAIVATVTVAGRGVTTMRAATGDYDNAAGRLVLEGGVVLDSADGYSLEMQDAAIDFKAGTLASAQPITVRYENSATTGRSLAVSEGGKIIVLDGGVRSTMMPPKRPAGGPPQPDKPALPKGS